MILYLRTGAEADLAAARDWYERQSPGLGGQFIDEVGWALQEVATAPEQPRLYYRNFRRVLLRRFPYKVFYQVIGERVVVFRVLHMKQDHHAGLSRHSEP